MPPKARAVMGRREKNLLCDPGSELQLFSEGEIEKKGGDRWAGQMKKKR